MGSGYPVSHPVLRFFSFNEYDGLHRRIQKDDGTTVTGYYYNEQWQCLVETEGTGGSETAEVMYMWHPHYVDALAVRMRADEDDEHFFTHDANFNITAAVADAGNAVVERYAYSPYGEVTVLNGATDADGAVAEWSPDSFSRSDISNEHLYTGRRTDPETGLQLNRRRFYHQQLGRWVSRDPIRYRGGMNLYGYVGGMPTYYVDPNGLQYKPTEGPIEYIPGIPSILEGTILEEVPLPRVPLRPPAGNCTIRVCSNPIGKPPLAIGSHIDIYMDGNLNGSEQSYQFTAGPSPERPQCQGQVTSSVFGQLVAAGLPLPPDHQDEGELHPERCKTIELGESCDRVFNCFAAKVKAINDSCIAYRPSPTPFFTGCSNGWIGGCNSNCVAGWLLGGCLENPPALPVIKPGEGIPAGWGLPAPKPVDEAR